MTSLRGRLVSYIEDKYKAKEEHLWRMYPGYAAFRHSDNQKWFALIMDVPANKLGMSGDEVVDIVNVKMSDLYLAEVLIQQEGFFRGYHISRGNWISILLDGTVEFEEICKWIDESFMTTASKETKHRLRPPKEWIIPANPKYYDVQAAFKRAEEIDWKQGKGIKTGDTVFMYIGAPVSAVLYKCVVTETDIPYHFQRKELTITSLMRIKLLKKYDPEEFTFDRLKNEFDIFAVRGPRGIPDSLRKALNA